MGDTTDTTAPRPPRFTGPRQTAPGDWWLLCYFERGSVVMRQHGEPDEEIPGVLSWQSTIRTGANAGRLVVV